ncbi:hypothetical protein BDW59DRAFT_147786 [Aspergillus cavernicola]|uniref:Exonuclease domain-containing protein n=1 Tax=Aspergillus cavernicola TaxID=176166 RepID=A0ABR4IBG1_9EURO
MVGVGAGGKESVLAQLVAVDVMTGDTVVDVCIQPGRPVTDWRTAFSGLTERSFRRYARRKKLLGSVQEAREELFKYVDASTVLVGHAVDNDLGVLEMDHDFILDTQLVAKLAVEEVHGGEITVLYKLRTMCLDLLHRWIQIGPGHDCTEDTFATRELLLFIDEQMREAEEDNLWLDWAWDRAWEVSHPEDIDVWRLKPGHPRRLQYEAALDKYQARAHLDTLGTPGPNAISITQEVW